MPRSDRAAGRMLRNDATDATGGASVESGAAMTLQDFPAKLSLVLKHLSIGRGRLAAELRVDKSVIARWLNGVHAPTGDNLSKLTTAVAARRPGFTGLDWESDLAGLGRRLLEGATVPAVGPEAATAIGSGSWIPPEVVREAILTTAARGDAYEGFWRSTRPAIEAPGRFIHDHILIRKGAHGLLEFRLRVIDMYFTGVAFPTQTQIFAFCADPHTGLFIFTIFNAVLRHRADVLDGLALTVQRYRGGSPVASAVVLERVGMLSEDPGADDARHSAEGQLDPFAPEGSISEAIRTHLNRNAGPEALAAGGDFLLHMPFATSMSRGPSPKFSARP